MICDDKLLCNTNKIIYTEDKEYFYSFVVCLSLKAIIFLTRQIITISLISGSSVPYARFINRLLESYIVLHYHMSNHLRWCQLRSLWNKFICFDKLAVRYGKCNWEQTTKTNIQLIKGMWPNKTDLMGRQLMFILLSFLSIKTIYLLTKQIISLCLVSVSLIPYAIFLNRMLESSFVF